MIQHFPRVNCPGFCPIAIRRSSWFNSGTCSPLPYFHHIPVRRSCLLIAACSVRKHHPSIEIASISTPFRLMQLRHLTNRTILFLLSRASDAISAYYGQGSCGEVWSFSCQEYDTVRRLTHQTVKKLTMPPKRTIRHKDHNPLFHNPLRPIL